MRSREEIIDLVDRVEQLILMGYTTAAQIKKALHHYHVTSSEATQYKNHVHVRWNRHQSAQDREQKRTTLIQMYMNNMREAYNVLRRAQDSMLPGALGEQNRAIGNISKIISQITEIEGLKERTVRVSGDRDGNPIQITAIQAQVLALEGMISNGFIDPETFTAIESTLLNGNNGSKEITGSIWESDPISSSSETS